MRGTGGFAGLRLPRAPSTLSALVGPAGWRNVAAPQAEYSGFAAWCLADGVREADRNGEREGFAPRT